METTDKTATIIPFYPNKAFLYRSVTRRRLKANNGVTII